MIKKIFLVIALFSSFNVIGQTPEKNHSEIIKIWKNETAKNQELQSKIDVLNTTITSLQNENNKLKEKIDLNTQKDDIRKEQLDTSLSIYSTTTGALSNKLDVIAIVIGVVGLVLTLLGVVLGFYINSKEKNIKKLLEKSDTTLKEYYKSQDEIETKINESKEASEELRTKIKDELSSLYEKLKKEELKDIKSEIQESKNASNQLKEQVESELSELYQRLKNEELKEIIKVLNDTPNQTSDHISRLITLNVSEENFSLFKNMVFSWEREPDIAPNIKYLLVFLINQFPLKMSANQQISEIVVNHWRLIGRSINYDKFVAFFSNYIEEFLNSKYGGIDKELGIIIKYLDEWYSSNYIADKFLFNKYQEKQQRFLILKMLKEHSQRMIYSLFRTKMINTYPEEANTEEENDLLAPIQQNNQN